MVTAIRQKAVVGKGGKVELPETELLEGTPVEIIVLTKARDETEYLLSSETNKKHLLEALANVNAGKVVEINLDDYDSGK